MVETPSLYPDMTAEQNLKLQYRVLGLPDGETRMKNVNVFCDSLKDAPYSRSVAEFIGFADGADSAAAELPSMAKTDAVRVMTIHKSKGLEFPVVFFLSCVAPKGQVPYGTGSK